MVKVVLKGAKWGICFLFLAQLVFANNTQAPQIKQEIMPEIRVRDINRKLLNFEELYKKGPVLINFWATWCGPCLLEMQAFKELDTPSENLQIISISIDAHDQKHSIKRVVNAQKFPFHIIHDANKDLYTLLAADAVPYTLLVNQQGEVVYRHSGFSNASMRDLEKVLETL